MNRHLLARIALILAAALPPAGLPAATPIEGRGGKCQECHRLSLETPPDGSGHAPFSRGDCWACHASHGSEGERVFIREGNGLCRCHRPEGQKFASRHAKPTPASIPCISCHKPHTSTRPHLLTDYLHKPLLTGSCSGCHEGNGGASGKMGADTCYRCHDKVSFQGVTLHQPVAEGDCKVCHDPHGSRYPFLLVSSYPKGAYVPWGEKTYSLCFDCHEKEAITTAGPDAPTEFKDAKRNLHRLHAVERVLSPLGRVSRESMSCGTCHQPHASLNPHLVRQDVDSGKGVLYLKLNYTVSNGTATCEVGCHRTVSYPSGGTQETVSVSPVAKARLPNPAPSYFSACIVECHRDEWGRFQKEAVVHDPVKKKQCADCHGEHGSEQRGQFARDQNAVCGRCHSAMSKEIVAGHGGMNVAGSRCLRCHDPHASAKAGLLKEYTHEPFAGLDCWECHEEGFGRAIKRRVDEVCSECHEEILKPARLHGDTSGRQCTACHDPHDSARPKLLVSSIPELCYGCHDRRGFNLASRHAPVAEGKCLDCHIVHGRKNQSFLVREGSSLCLGCHDPQGKTFLNRHSRLPVGKASCQGCHQPHSSEQKKLVRADVHRPLRDGKCITCHKAGGALQAASVSDLCFRCHDAAGYRGPSRHEPAASGECTGCHDPHGSRFKPLLVSAYSRERYLKYREQSFGLCFTCHDSGAFSEAGPGADTSFKNETSNLHFLHVVKRAGAGAGAAPPEGITCRNCHLPHASLSPHLVRQEMDCGGGVQCLKLAYAVREGKATCRGGCHRAASYSTADDTPSSAP